MGRHLQPSNRLPTYLFSTFFLGWTGYLIGTLAETFFDDATFSISIPLGAAGTLFGFFSARRVFKED